TTNRHVRVNAIRPWIDLHRRAPVDTVRGTRGEDDVPEIMTIPRNVEALLARVEPVGANGEIFLVVIDASRAIHIGRRPVQSTIGRGGGSDEMRPFMIGSRINKMGIDSAAGSVEYNRRVTVRHGPGRRNRNRHPGPIRAGILGYPHAITA